jgi:hypothetical protein
MTSVSGLSNCYLGRTSQVIYSEHYLPIRENGLTPVSGEFSGDFMITSNIP